MTTTDTPAADDLPDGLGNLVASLPEDDRRRLAQVLGVDIPPTPTDVEEAAATKALARALTPFAVAGAAELIDQMTGRQVHSRMKDHEQYRLLKLALHAFGGRLPDPDRVAELFQKNASEAKTLLRNTAVRYRYELASNMNSYAHEVLLHTAVRAAEHDWLVEVRDAALLEHMTEAVRRGPGNPTGIAKTDEMHVHRLDKSTMTALLATIGHSYADFVQDWEAHQEGNG